MSFSISTEIDAPVERVWTVLANVENWPSWTATMERISGMDGSELAAGRRFQVKQPRFAPAIYVVTDMSMGESFVWESRVPGLRTRADHRLTRTDTGTHLVLTFEYSGFLGLMMGLMFGGMTSRYLSTEAGGLARICESS